MTTHLAFTSCEPSFDEFVTLSRLRCSPDAWATSDRRTFVLTQNPCNAEGLSSNGVRPASSTMGLLSGMCGACSVPGVSGTCRSNCANVVTRSRGETESATTSICRVRICSRRRQARGWGWNQLWRGGRAERQAEGGRDLIATTGKTRNRLTLPLPCGQRQRTAEKRHIFHTHSHPSTSAQHADTPHPLPSPWRVR